MNISDRNAVFLHCLKLFCILMQYNGRLAQLAENPAAPTNIKTQIGRLAQLVQSVRLTRVRSLVRPQQRPQNKRKISIIFTL